VNNIKFSPRTLIILLLILLVSGAFFGWYLYNKNKEAPDSEANQSLVAPAEEPYVDASGEIIDLSLYTNQIRVVNSWASWSPLSKDELPLINDIAKEYENRGIIFLAINRMENSAYAQGYLESLPELPALKIIFDPADNFFSKTDGYAMPETIVFDKQGNTVAHYRGAINATELKGELDKLLAIP
jgi:thiol-disulfide isomerase/thioredoxin